MGLDPGPEIARFRTELRAWIAAEAPDALAGLTDWNLPLTAGGRRGARLAQAQAHPAYAEWEAKLAARRLICPHWPEEFGGQGMDAVRVAVLSEEFDRAAVPRVTRGMGEAPVGPAVMVHGTPEQRACFLPRIISGEDVYCQGFSEPGHGSDLAAVQTRGVVEGDELVIDGLPRPEGDGYPVSAWQGVFLSSRAGAICSGTSEIQRNIVGERALGLPREPR